MAKKGQYPIPFDKDGNLLAYPTPFYLGEWRDNHVFEDTLKYIGYVRGQSAARLKWQSVNTGKTYEMFMDDFDYLMKRSGIEFDEVCAAWTFCKRGQNYGVRLADAKEE